MQLNKTLPRRSIATACLNRAVDIGMWGCHLVGGNFYRTMRAADLRRRGVGLTGTPRYISPSAFIDPTNYAMIEIGDQVVISAHVSLLTHDYSVVTAALACGENVDREFRRAQGISIGTRAFIGIGAILMPGVTVGEYSIVGAGSIVTRSVPSRVVAAGNPARVLCSIEDYWSKCKQDLSDYYLE